MKLLWVIVTIAFTLQVGETAPAVTEEVLKDRLQKQVNKYVKIVDNKASTLEKELKSNNDDVKGLKDGVKSAEDLKETLQGIKKEIEAIKDLKKCTEEKKNLDELWAPWKTSPDGNLNKMIDTCTQDYKSISKDVNTDEAIRQIGKYKSTLNSLVGQCANDWRNQNSNILACVYIGLKDFKSKWKTFIGEGLEKWNKYTKDIKKITSDGKTCLQKIKTDDIQNIQNAVQDFNTCQNDGGSGEDNKTTLKPPAKPSDGDNEDDNKVNPPAKPSDGDNEDDKKVNPPAKPSDGDNKENPSVKPSDGHNEDNNKETPSAKPSDGHNEDNNKEKPSIKPADGHNEDNNKEKPSVKPTVGHNEDNNKEKPSVKPSNAHNEDNNKETPSWSQ